MPAKPRWASTPSASSITIPYIYAKTTATLAVGALEPAPITQSASNLFDLYFTPIVAGYHFSKDENLSLSLNIWAPTGKYDPALIANPSLNNWTFIPAVAYTKSWPSDGLEFDATMGVQFYTRNSATNYQNAPLFTLNLMGLKLFENG